MLVRETGNLTRESAIHLLFPELEGKEIKTNDDINRELASRHVIDKKVKQEKMV